MSKFISFYLSRYDATPRKFGEDNTLEEAARRCDDYVNGERGHACINAILDRGYYGIGFGSSQVYVEEVK